MKSQYYTSSSLDGLLATEDDSLEWSFPLGDTNDTSYPSFIEGVGAIAMGSSPYEWILRNAGPASDQTGTVWPYAQPTPRPTRCARRGTTRWRSCLLQDDPALCHPPGDRRAGKLLMPRGFGMVLANIARNQFDQMEVEHFLPPRRPAISHQATVDGDARSCTAPR